MRMIACECCSGAALWVVFDRLPVCDTCRLQVVTWFKDSWVDGLASHPFLDTFVGVQRPRIRLTPRNPRNNLSTPVRDA